MDGDIRVEIGAMVKEEHIVQLIDMLKLFAKEHGEVHDWGSTEGDNCIKQIEFCMRLDDLENSKLTVTDTRCDKDRFVITIVPNANVTSWKEFEEAIYQAIYLSCEPFLFVQRTFDEEYIKYWYATGYLTGFTAHGHVGVLQVRIGDIAHIEPRFINPFDTIEDEG